MKWFDKWLYKRVENGSRINQEDMEDVKITKQRDYNTNVVGSHLGPRSPDTPGTNLIMYTAVGGLVIEVRTHDKKSDRYENTLHIVTSDQDMAEAIARIITYTSLTR